MSGRRSWESSSPEPGCKQSWDRPGRCRAPGPGPEPAAPLAPLPDRLNGLLPAGHLPCGMLHHGVSPEVGVLLAEPQGPEHETSREQPRSPRAGALPVRRASLGQSGPGSHTVGGREGGRGEGGEEGRKECALRQVISGSDSGVLAEHGACVGILATPQKYREDSCDPPTWEPGRLRAAGGSSASQTKGHVSQERDRLAFGKRKVVVASAPCPALVGRAGCRPQPVPEVSGHRRPASPAPLVLPGAGGHVSLSAWDGALPNRLQAWSPAGTWSFRDVESAATVTVPHEPRGEARGWRRPETVHGRRPQ